MITGIRNNNKDLNEIKIVAGSKKYLDQNKRGEILGDLHTIFR